MSWRQPGIDDRRMMQEILELLVADGPSTHQDRTASTTVHSGVDGYSNEDGVRREFHPDSEFSPDSVLNSSYSGASLNEEMKEIVNLLGTDGVRIPGFQSRVIDESPFVNNRSSTQDGLKVPQKEQQQQQQ
uniref:Uncharacterized protein n=1 Tax=Peronospora matthiolae TaxID=2874970 RepID=A0AAV1VIG7_9STRA